MRTLPLRILLSLFWGVMLGLAQAALAAAITSVVANDTKVKFALDNATAQSVRIYPVPIHTNYNAAAPGTAIYSGTGNGSIAVDRVQGGMDLLYSGFQLTDSANVAIGNTQFVTDVTPMQRVWGNDVNGWHATSWGFASYGVSNSVYAMTFYNPAPNPFDPVLENNDILLNTANGRYLVVRCRLTNPGKSTMPLGVYSFGGASFGYQAATINATGAWQTVVLDLATGSGDPWTGDRRLRIDPADGEPDANLYTSALFEIDWMALTNNASFDGTALASGDVFWPMASDGNTRLVTAQGSKGLAAIKDQNDAVALKLKYATLNVTINDLVDWDNNGSAPVYVTVDGQTIRLDAAVVYGLDRQVKLMSDAGIHVLMILNNIVPTTAQPGNPMIHPATNLASAPFHLGAFNLTDQAGYRHYRAAIEFLAQRYAHKDSPFGVIGGLVVGNELNAHWDWYNMGAISLANFLPDYERALRVTDLALRAVNNNSRAYISLTHHWNSSYSADTNKGFKGKDFVDQLNSRVSGRGNIPWALAHHPYPENAVTPWNDSGATFSFTTSKITPKNLEVLATYFQQAALLWNGQPRTIDLTEQGFNQAGKTQAQQAAAYCYTQHRVAFIPGIRSFIVHRQVDHANEGGALFGIWTRDTGSPEPDKLLAPKEAYNCVKYADTTSWRTYFDPYLSYQPATTWDALLPKRTTANFTFDDRVGLAAIDGWTALSQVSGLAAANGILSGTATGTDPQIQQANTWFWGGGTPTISIMMKVNAATNAELFWKTTSYSTYSSTRKVAFSVINDGKYHLYTLNMAGASNWSNQIITSLRLDPTATNGATFSVAYIMAGTPQRPGWHFANALDGWTVANQLDEPRVYQDYLLLHANGADPFMQTTQLSFAGSSRTQLALRMATTAGTLGQLYWITTEDPVWSEAKSQTFALVSNGQDQFYTVDLSAHGQWAGKEIIGLRLDPTNAIADVDLDWVEVRAPSTLLQTSFEPGEGWIPQGTWPTANWTQTVGGKTYTGNVTAPATEAWWVRYLGAGAGKTGDHGASIRAASELIASSVNAPGLLSFWAMRSGNDTGMIMAIQKSVNGGNWTTVRTIDAREMQSGVWSRFDVPVNDPGSNVALRWWVNYRAAGNITIDDVLIQGM